MNKIPQMVRIIHTKDYDVDVLYIKEFLRTIGCLTCNCVKKDNLELTSDEKEQQYDVNIFYGLKEDISQSQIQNGIYIKENFIKELRTKEEILREVVENIWPKEQYPFNEELKAICKYYKDIAVCLYNNINIGFINEYYPVNNNGLEVIKLKKEVCELTYNAFLQCYNKLYDYKYKQSDKEQEVSVYYEYAMLNLKYRMNEIQKLDQGELIFDTDKMIKDAKNILKKKRRFYYCILSSSHNM